jgi:anionic cell wall polymer biosynthesis LytR-Cps2A-Psr (LCP) family protein
MAHDLGLSIIGLGLVFLLFLIYSVIYFVIKTSKKIKSDKNDSSLDILKKDMQVEKSQKPNSTG